MLNRANLFRFVTGLSRLQKRAVFLAVDTTLGPLVAAIVILPGLSISAAALWPLLIGLAAISAVASICTGLPRIKLDAYEIRAVAATAKFATLATLGWAGLCHAAGLGFHPAVLAAFLTALLCATVASRFLMLAVLRWVLRNGQRRSRVLIYGAGETGLRLATLLRSMPHIQTLGFLDDNLDLQAMTVGGLPVLSAARAEAIVRKLCIERVYLAMPSLTGRKVLMISKLFRDLGIDVQTTLPFSHLNGAEPWQNRSQMITPGAVLGRMVLADDIPQMDFAYRGRVLFVSGAGGSVGSELCRQLLAHRPKRLVLFERSEIALYTIEQELRERCAFPEVEIVAVLGTVTDARQTRSTLTEFAVEVVFHAAAYKHVPLVEVNPVAGIENNVLGTRILADAALVAGVAQFVLISTDKAVRPTSVMGATKRMAELLVQDMAKRSAATKFSIVRFGNVLGSSGSVLPRFREQIARGGPITLTDENVTRYFMTLAEAARLVLVAGAFCGHDDKQQASVFVLDMGKPVKIRDLAERMVAAAGLSLCTADNPGGDIEIVVTDLRPGEKLHEELFFEKQALPTPHPKILRAHESGLSEFAMASALNAARRAVTSGDHHAARLVLETWIEDFPGRMADNQALWQTARAKITAFD